LYVQYSVLGTVPNFYYVRSALTNVPLCAPLRSSRKPTGLKWILISGNGGVVCKWDWDIASACAALNCFRLAMSCGSLLTYLEKRLSTRLIVRLSCWPKCCCRPHVLPRNERHKAHLHHDWPKRWCHLGRDKNSSRHNNIATRVTEIHCRVGTVSTKPRTVTRVCL
jgi:hypothetical protein